MFLHKIGFPRRRSLRSPLHRRPKQLPCQGNDECTSRVVRINMETTSRARREVDPRTPEAGELCGASMSAKEA